MKDSLLALSKLGICITQGFTQNVRSFVVVLHDIPLKVEQTLLYSFVKDWRTAEDVEQAISTPLISLPPRVAAKNTPAY